MDRLFRGLWMEWCADSPEVVHSRFDRDVPPNTLIVSGVSCLPLQADAIRPARVVYSFPHHMPFLRLTRVLLFPRIPLRSILFAFLFAMKGTSRVYAGSLLG